jgi:ABC-type transport system involved in cytochrome c biogenesis permease component
MTMKSLMQHGLVVLILSLGAGSAGASGAAVAPGIAEQGHAAVAALRRDFAEQRRLEAREQLHSVLPAALAATPVVAEPVQVVVVRVQSESPPRRSFTFSLRGKASESERGTLRWQSLLPGMMK